MDPRIERTLAAMHARFATRLSLADLARAVNLSTSRVAHRFQQEVGTSPRQYLRALRMTARLMLEQTHLSIKEVMVQVGCNDPSHFTRDFRRFHGGTPRQWRASIAARAQDPVADPDASLAVAQIAALANKRQKRPTEAAVTMRRGASGLHF